VQKALIDMENMFELLATAPAVADEPGARSLRVSEGRVDFKEVRPQLCGGWFVVLGCR
jgi:ABC-type transport system involved in Fe-S cluster assembly fused permease/ATPase subunit